MTVTVDGRCTVVRNCRSRNTDSGIDVTLVSLMSKTSRLDRLFVTKFQSLAFSLPVIFSVRRVPGVIPKAIILFFNSPPFGLSMVIGLAVNVTSNVPTVVPTGIEMVPSVATVKSLPSSFTEISSQPISGSAFKVVELPCVVKKTSPSEYVLLSFCNVP